VAVDAETPLVRASKKMVAFVAAQKAIEVLPAAEDTGAPTWEEEDDENDEEVNEENPDLSWIDLPWTEMEGGRECCQRSLDEVRRTW
jgi:hypothetical protein